MKKQIEQLESSQTSAADATNQVTQLETQLAAANERLKVQASNIDLKESQIQEMDSKLRASHSDVKETATKLADLQVQLQRMSSHDASVHSLQEQLDSKNSAINVSAALTNRQIVIFWKWMYL